MEQQPPAKSKNNGFFSFQKMISRTLIQIIYILGAVFITLGGLRFLVMAANMRSSGSLVITGLGLLIVGNLIWRIVCEAWILLFSIHDLLASIDRKL